MNTVMSANQGQRQGSALHVQEVVSSATQELHDLMQRRTELMKRIGALKKTLDGLASIFGDSLLTDEMLTLLNRKSASRQPGLTRACRMFLMESARPLAARPVCQALQRKFPELLERHKHPIASVTTVLTRLADYAEAQCSLDVNGVPVWEWNREK